MDIPEQLSLLQRIKSDCKIAIENKDVNIPLYTPFSSYADLIRAIKFGQGNELSQIKEPLKRRISENLKIVKNETQ